MNSVERFAYARLPSFRREHGGLYAPYVAVYSRLYRTRMRRLHSRGRHGPLMSNGRCTWCGEPAQSAPAPDPYGIWMETVPIRGSGCKREKL